MGTARLDLTSARRLTVDRAGMGVSLVGECGGRVVAMAGFYKERPSDDRAMDLNPLKILSAGVCAVDVRVKVHRDRPRPHTRRIAY